MNLYIETNNGQTINHPAFEDNLIQAFGSIPEHFEPFVRVERPKGNYKFDFIAWNWKEVTAS